MRAALNLMLLTFTMLGTAAAKAASGCGETGVAVQVLGSGGPAQDGKRASSSYIIWQDGKARVLVDAGGGAMLRFAEAGATLEDLSAVAITHFHADHSADVPVLIKKGFFSDRVKPLAIIGPTGGEAMPGLGTPFPGLQKFLSAVFDPQDGAYRYLSWSLDGEAGPFHLQPTEIKYDAEPQIAFDKDGIILEAVGVKHGPVPALGYIARIDGLRIAFTGDQNGQNPAFWQLAKNSDLVIAHHAVSEGADPVAAALHASPTEIGTNASMANVKHVVLSHLMKRSLDTLDANLAIIKQLYKGRLDVAADLACYPVKRTAE